MTGPDNNSSPASNAEDEESRIREGLAYLKETAQRRHSLDGNGVTSGEEQHYKHQHDKFQESAHREKFAQFESKSSLSPEQIKQEERDSLRFNADLADQEAKTKQQHLHNEALQTDNKMRQQYASKAYGFVWFWSGAVLFLIFINGLFSAGIATRDGAPVTFMSENVTLALITAATVNVLAAFLAVMHNLFPKNGQGNKPPDDSSQSS